jgi:hypothetical protein
MDEIKTFAVSVGVGLLDDARGGCGWRGRGEEEGGGVGGGTRRHRVVNLQTQTRTEPRSCEGGHALIENKNATSISDIKTTMIGVQTAPNAEDPRACRRTIRR